MNMDNGQPLLRLENVSKVFVTDEVETHALQSIHFDVKKGEYLSISGPSGCGKSTLLAILGLLDTPTDGTYYLNGKPVTGLKLSERARIRNREIGFIFQAFNLIGDLTVYENVELPLTYRGMPSAERKKRVQDALERVGMSHRMKHYPSPLWGCPRARRGKLPPAGRFTGKYRGQIVGGRNGCWATGNLCTIFGADAAGAGRRQWSECFDRNSAGGIPANLFAFAKRESGNPESV